MRFSRCFRLVLQDTSTSLLVVTEKIPWARVMSPKTLKIIPNTRRVERVSKPNPLFFFEYYIGIDVVIPLYQ